MSWSIGLEHILRPDEPLSRHTWFALGGAAEWFAEPTSIAELRMLLQRTSVEGVPLRLLGGGSNVLVRDEGVPGVVAHLGAPAFAAIDARGDRIVAGSGAKLGHVVSIAVREGLAGLETLVGIPGTLGGAVRGNASSRNADIGQWTERVTIIERGGEIRHRSRQELVFAHGESNLDDLAIVEVELQLDRDDPRELIKRLQKQWIVKKAAQPMSDQRTGRIFKNPQGQSAGDLIDSAGLKGARLGGAEVSQRHGNYIVADSGASSQDVIRLIELLQQRVLQRTGVELEVDLEIW